VTVDGMFHLVQRFIRRPGVRWALAALLVYALATLVLMYPVPFRLSSVVAGKEHGDAYQYTWSLWWARQAVLEPDKDLGYVTLMNHPAGVAHPLMLTMIGVDMLALPFSLLLSPAAVYNSQILLSFILSGMAMYWLCTELTGDHRAGIVGGFIFAFFPNKTGHVLGGHLPQVTVCFFPLYVLFLRRVIRRPGWRTALAAALALILAGLVHVMHVVYLVLPVTVAVVLTALREMGSAFFTRQRLCALALAFGLAAIAVIPFLLPTVLLYAGGAGYLHKAGTVKYSTDLLAFFTPSPYHPVLGPLGLVPPFAERIFYDQETLYEGLAYPGILAMGLALWGLIQQGRRAWVWGVLAALAAVLSLGPLLKVGNELVSYQVDTHQSYVVLPYALLKQMPLLAVGRTPGRLNETTMFCTAILASYGGAALSALLARRRRLLATLLALLLVGIGFEYVTIWPVPVSSAEIPRTIERIASESGDGALLHLPTENRRANNRALYYQTVAGRPIVRGYIHRIPPEVLPWSQTLSGLAQPDQASGDIVPRPSLAERVAWLRYFDVDYVVSHKLEPESEAFQRNFVQTLLGSPRYEDHDLAAFPVPDDVPALASPRLYTLSHEGWYPPEWDGNLWRRWMVDDGRLYLYSPREAVGSLRFTVDSYLEFPVLEVYQGEQLLDSFVVGERTTYTTRPFTLVQGMNVFRFHAPGGYPQVLDSPHCWSEALLAPPVENTVSCDPEALRTTRRTFVFDHVSFVTQGDLLAGEALDVNLGDRMRFRGWRLDGAVLHPGEALTVTLAWEATVELSDQYVVFVHLLSSDGTLVAQHDAPPAGRLLPPSSWPPETVFSYPVTIELPGDLAAGDYLVQVGVYLWPGLERLPVRAEMPGAEIGVMKLGHVRIAPLDD